MSTIDTKIITSEDKILAERSIYGNKAYWLSWLSINGYNTPYSVYLPATTPRNLEVYKNNILSDEKFNSSLMKISVSNNDYDIAVRSSSTLEDSQMKSFAGHFTSILGRMNFINILKSISVVVESINKYESLGAMGIVLQRKIDATISGVFISSNPHSALKEDSIISFIDGLGEGLVSGDKQGETLILKNGKPINETEKINISQDHLDDIYEIAKRIEDTLNIPIDIEWCIERKTNKLFILQCRPLTGIIPQHVGINEIKLSNKELLPSNLIDNDKIKLRLVAEENDIHISKAYLLIIHCLDKNISIDLSQIIASEFCVGYSIVLLHPKKIDGKIIRYFCENDNLKNIKNFMPCQRYIIRSLGSRKDIESNVKKIFNLSKQVSWYSAMIIQELYHPFFTGMLKEDDNAFYIEIAKGHFLPKGVSIPSTYILDKGLNILSQNEIIQKKYFEFSNGEIIENSIEETVCLEKNDLIKIIHAFRNIDYKNKFTIEFGLVEANDKAIVPYLIDLIDDKNSDSLDIDLVKSGVISKGIIEGKLIQISEESDQKSLNVHYHDSLSNSYQDNGKYIFYCNKPAISLIEIVNQYKNDCIGFVFQEGSILAHLSIVLREKNIPAIIIGNIPEISESSNYKLDAKSPLLKPKERLIKND